MKILIVVAHPDDEILWCWPVLQNPKNERSVIAISDNRGDASLTPFHGLGKMLGYETQCLGFPPNFYSLPTRNAPVTLPRSVNIIRQALAIKIEEYKPDLIFTHNPWGEYGHGDHRLTAELVYTSGHPRIWTTNICIKNKSHVSYEQIPGHFKSMLRFLADKETGKQIDPVRIDLQFYKLGANTYQQYQVWSWSGEVACECEILEIAQ